MLVGILPNKDVEEFEKFGFKRCAKEFLETFNAITCALQEAASLCLSVQNAL